jgi:hypothetical protein
MEGLMAKEEKTEKKQEPKAVALPCWMYRKSEAGPVSVLCTTQEDYDAAVKSGAKDAP